MFFEHRLLATGFVFAWDARIMIYCTNGSKTCNVTKLLSKKKREREREREKRLVCVWGGGVMGAFLYPTTKSTGSNHTATSSDVHCSSNWV